MNIHKLQCFNNPKATQDFFHQLHHGIHTSTFQVTSLLPKSSNRRFHGHYPKALWISYFHNKCLNLPSRVVQPSPRSFTKTWKSKMLMSEVFRPFCSVRLFLGHLEQSGLVWMHKPDHLAPTKAWINWINVQKAWSVFPRFSCPLSPSFWQSFHSKWAKTRFAHCTTLFILEAANLHSAEHVKRLRDVRLFNELKKKKKHLNSATFPSADSFV